MIQSSVGAVDTKPTKAPIRAPTRNEAEGLAWCLALHRKIQRKRQAQEVRRADHR